MMMKHKSNLTTTSSDHEVVMKEISKTHELISQLQALLMPFIPASLADTASNLVKQALRSSNSAMSILQAGSGGGESSDLGSVDSRETAENEKKRKCSESQADKTNTRKRRKNHGSWSVVTTVPYEDGYQWRKYGQKLISSAKHPRNYFRCTYSKEQGCPATKTVQQETCESNPANYRVIYCNEHTCKEPSSTPFVLECYPPPTAVSSTPSVVTTSTPSVVSTSRDGSLSPVSDLRFFAPDDNELMPEPFVSSPATIDMFNAPQYWGLDWEFAMDYSADFSHGNYFDVAKSFEI